MLTVTPSRPLLKPLQRRDELELISALATATPTLPSTCDSEPERRAYPPRRGAGDRPGGDYRTQVPRAGARALR